MLRPSGLDPIAVRRQFERRGAALSEADFLLREVERVMLERLEAVRIAPTTLLDVGCGLGNGLVALRKRYPGAHALGVDSARSVAAAAARRLGPPPAGLLKRLLPDLIAGARPALADLLVADAARLPIRDGSVDMVWSNLCLHWLPDAQAAVDEWHRVIRPGGLLMFSAFGVDTLRELRAEGAELMAFNDMHDVGDALVAAGFADPVMDMSFVTLTFDDARKLLLDVSALGGNGLANRRRGLTARAHHADWLSRLSRKRDGAGKLSLTFEVFHGHAWCPTPKRLPRGLAPLTFQRR